MSLLFIFFSVQLHVEVVLRREVSSVLTLTERRLMITTAVRRSCWQKDCVTHSRVLSGKHKTGLGVLLPADTVTDIVKSHAILEMVRSSKQNVTTNRNQPTNLSVIWALVQDGWLVNGERSVVSHAFWDLQMYFWHCKILLELVSSEFLRNNFH